MKALLPILMLMISCNQSINSNSNDQLVFGEQPEEEQVIGPDGEVAELTVFQRARTTIRSKCIACHTNYHIGIESDDEATLIASLEGIGYIVSGDADGSFMLRRLTNYGDIGGMPQAPMQPLTQEEYDDLKEWIDSLQ